MNKPMTEPLHIADSTACSPHDTSTDLPNRPKEKHTDTASQDDILGRALDFVRHQILDGLRHGFFELTVTSELIKDRKRRLLVKAGKCHQFTIPANEVDGSQDGR
jgi:hypothetical protein